MVISDKDILKSCLERIAILVCLLLPVFAMGQSQVKFYINATKTATTLNQVQVDVIVEANGNLSISALDPPPMPDFQQLGESNMQESGNGFVRITASYTYAPRKTGTFNTGKARAVISGKTIESNELSITISAPTAQQQQQFQQQQQRQQQQQQAWIRAQQQQMQQVQQQMQQMMQQIQGEEDVKPASGQVEKQLKEYDFVQIIPDKTEAYIGELVTARMVLYSYFDVARCGMTKAPAFDGFWSQDVKQTGQPKVRIETKNGKQFKVQDIQVFNLYPQRTGTLKVPPTEIEMIVQAPVNTNYGQVYQAFDLKTMASGFSINVKDPPLAGRPDNFSGAVGKYSYSAKLSSTEGKTDNALTYTIKISGTGNLKTIDLPKPEFPDGFEVFDPKVKDDVTSGIGGMSGSKEYDYLIIPRQPGEYKIAATSFSYFDPSVGKYTTLTSPEFALKITGEPSQNPNASATASKDISLLHSDIRYIKTKGNHMEKTGAPLFGSATYAGLLTAPVFLFIGLIFVKRKNEDLAADLVGARRRRATKLAKKRLAAAEKHLARNDKQLFYDEISRALWGYLANKLNIDHSQLSKDNVEEQLLAKNVKTESINRLKGLISTCEVALYAPAGAAEEMKQNYNAAVSLIADLEDEIK